MDTVKDVRGALKNQNIADIIASARAKLAQAASHPDAVTELSKLRAEHDRDVSEFGGEQARNPGLKQHPFGANEHGTGPDMTDGKSKPLFDPSQSIG